MVELSGSLLGADFAKIQSEVSRLEKLVDSWHVDVMDNNFVPNNTLDKFPPAFVKNLKTEKPQDVHLMVEKPSKYFEGYALAGARSITFHCETERNCVKAIDAIHDFGVKAGVSLKPKTPVSAIEKFLPLVDIVLVMSVEPGFGGQTFMPSALDKISELRRKDAGDIAVDGGINEITGKQCEEAGANILIAGTALFKAQDVEKFASTLRQ
jgi:ribulose-phosphate 3-epimerase